MRNAGRMRSADYRLWEDRVRRWKRAQSWEPENDCCQVCGFSTEWELNCDDIYTPFDSCVPRKGGLRWYVDLNREAEDSVHGMEMGTAAVET